MSAFPELAAVAGPGRIEPFLQPVARLSDGALVGFEALARWRRDDGGVEGAASFFPNGPWTDENAEIGRAVGAAAIEAFAAWRRPRAAHLSVNIIGRDLYDGAARRLADLAQARGIAPGELVLELTEHHALPDMPAAAAELAALRDRGVRIALDDFGTGHSSLAWLARLPVDALKIDRSFVSRITEPGVESLVIAAVLSLARALGLDVIAEGLETEAQRAELLARGCTLGQGGLFAMPLPAAEAFALF
ncbi:MAG: EAL domain-containing protein [Hydrogenophilaceae bacterium]|jgi:EAL domain-containing protein (putative c-di-GMP-specific phosphodiesterase class I)|nr:EAL domain-containing protein [Hydrogenophilaceae bacterium]